MDPDQNIQPMRGQDPRRMDRGRPGQSYGPRYGPRFEFIRFLID